MAGVSEEKGAGPGELGTPDHCRISQDSYSLHFHSASGGTSGGESGYSLKEVGWSRGFFPMWWFLILPLSATTLPFRNPISMLCAMRLGSK